MSRLALLGGTPVIGQPLAPYRSTGSAELRAVTEVMESDSLSGFHGSPGPLFMGGPRVKAFEEAWRQRYGVRHAISANSATSGLQMAMGAIGISPGDEVIVPPYTMSATVISPLIWGGIPVFVDIDPDTFCLDASLVEAAITPRTRAIIAVNLFGGPAPLRALREIADRHGIRLIEDSAQAPLGEEYGRLCGTVGDIGIFSLNYHKHIHSGEGGVCITNDDSLAARLAAIRNHGENIVKSTGVEDLTNLVGFNFRLTELSAAVAAVQLDGIDEHVCRREEVARILSEGTADLPGWTPPLQRPDTRHNYYMWSVRYDGKSNGVSREDLSAALNAEGFPNEVGYVEPLYRLPLFQRRIAIGREGFPFNLTGREYPDGLCPVAERLYESELLQFQPPSWNVDAETAERLVDAVRKVFENLDELRLAVSSRE